MIIGVPKEIKNHEYRVGVTPDAPEVTCLELRIWSDFAEAKIAL